MKGITLTMLFWVLNEVKVIVFQIPQIIYLNFHDMEREYDSSLYQWEIIR